MATTSTFTVYEAVFGHIKRELLGPLAEAGARIVRDEIVRTIDPGPVRTGRRYRIPGTAASYTASAPGEPPAVRLGIYRDGWDVTPAQVRGAIVEASAVNDVKAEDGRPLGLYLERGTKRMRPRPHVRPALPNAGTRIWAAARAAVER